MADAGYWPQLTEADGRKSKIPTEMGKFRESLTSEGSDPKAQNPQTPESGSP
jgi:hypothetical protein